MNTIQLLVLLENQISGISRDGPNGLLFFIDQAQKLLLNNEGDQNVVYDEATGDMPLLATQAGVFTYDAPDDCRLVDKVIMDAGVSGGLFANVYGTYYTDYDYQYLNKVRIERYRVAGREHIRVPFIRTTEATDTQNAKIIFTEDPQDTTDIYRILYYRKTGDLLSDTMNLSIGTPYDMKYLFPATLKLVQGYQDGNLAEALIYIEDVLQKRYKNDLGKGEQGTEMEAIPRF